MPSCLCFSWGQKKQPADTHESPEEPKEPKKPKQLPNLTHKSPEEPKKPPYTHKSPEEPKQFPNFNGLPSTSPSSVVPARSISEDDDVWVEAEKLLRDDDATKKIMETATKILQDKGCQFDDNDPQKHQKISTFLSAKSQAVKSQIASREIFQTISQNILSFKDVITTAASASPPAAIACAGFMVVLQFFIKVAQGKSIFLEGLEKISALIPQINQIQKTYINPQGKLDEIMPQFMKRLTELCRKVLEFHAKALCYLSKNTAAQDILHMDLWSNLIRELESCHKEVTNFTSIIGQENLQVGQQNLQDQITQAENDKKRSALLKILDTCPYADRKNRNRERVPGTCEWFTSHDRFKNEWDEQSKFPVLWVSADPGCGKSVLTRYLVDEVLREKNPNRKICYFFFKDDLQDQNTATSALSCLLHQLISYFPSLPKLAEKKYEDHKEKLVSSFQDLWDILESVASDPKTGEVVFVIDALDECRDKDRDTFIKAVSDYCLNHRQQTHTVKFLITSRPYDSIRTKFIHLEKEFPEKIHLSGDSEEIPEKISDEIGLVVESLIKEIGVEKNLTPSKIDFFIQKMQPKSDLRNRTYLWVTLTLDFIRNMPGFNKGEVEDSLQSLPESVNQAYEKILSQTKNTEKATLLLHIVLAATRPLSLEELSICFALQKVSSDDEVLYCKDSAENFKIKVRELCGLLLLISDGKVYLLHQTLKEFLVPKDSSDNTTIENSTKPPWKASFTIRESNSVLGRRCVWFLHSNLTDLTLRVFLEYASENWDHHIRFLYPRQEKDEGIVELCLPLCDSGSTVFKKWCENRDRQLARFQNEATSLLIASYLGIGVLVQKMLLRSSLDLDVDAKDTEYGQTPLSWAARSGHDAVVKILLDTNKVDIDAKDKYGRTPLSWAAKSGHNAVVKMLLDTNKVDVDAKDEYGRTPLSRAARSGHDAVVKILLDINRVDVDAKDTDGQTPLSRAAESGHDAVVKILLDTNKVYVDSKDRNGRTPLSRAARRGHDAVVKILLDINRVDVNAKDKYGRTPLSRAARYGHDAIVMILLDTNKVDVDAKDTDGQTPLSWAAESGHDAVVKMLLDTNKVDVDAKDTDGQTPLSRAARRGHDAVVKILLDTNKVDVDAKDTDGQTPLSWAAESGHDAVVKMLLDTNKVDVDAKDEYGRTPLSWAARSGHDAVVKMLLDTGSVDVDAKDKYGRTPLSRAARYGHDAIVMILLDTNKVDVDAKDTDGRTPLSWAAEGGHNAVVEMLREKGGTFE